LVKYLSIGGRGVKAAIKRYQRGWGIREFFRLLRAPRAMRNFIAGVKIRQAGLPVARPLAAVYRRRFLFCTQSIYISEYIDGENLYEYLKKLPADSRERYWVIEELSRRLAGIFAGLHKKGLWHRDAKATNFVVYEDDEGIQAAITDVDGIKQYFMRKESSQMRALWRLAASVMCLGGINRTDYLRAFRAYCEEARVPEEQREGIFRQLAQKAEAKHQSDSRSRGGQI
jgi:tRNA A-37 threonylcarbamoyl transferase component Bud32